MRLDVLGILLIALGEPTADGKRLCLKIGGGKSAGLGSLRVEGLKLSVWQDPREAYLAYDNGDILTKTSTETYLAAAQAEKTLLEQKALKRLQAILGCPTLGGSV